MDHSMDGMDGMDMGDASAQDGQGAAAHEHGQPEAAMAPGQRQALTVLFAVLTYAGYGLILAAGMAAAEQAGFTIGRAQAILWGLSGFLAFQLLPALGLAPELPGTPAADLDARQLWWAGTVIASILGLGCLAYGKGAVLKLVGVAALAAPHVVGAPELGGYGGVVPPELASGFAARTLGVGLATWAVLGAVVQWLWHSERA